MTGDPKSLDPAHATDVRTGQLCALLYDNLVHFGKGPEILPGLAESWRVSTQGKQYYFKLRKDVYFKNGDIFSCQDIKASFERILSPKTQSHRTWLFNKVKGAKQFKENKAETVSGFNCVSNTEFEIELTQAFSPFLGLLAMPAAAIIKESQSGEIIGTGPWVLQEWIHDGHLIFNRNENYFDGPPKSKHLKVRILPEALPRSAEFITGYLDIMEIPEAEFDLWVNDPHWVSHIQYQDDLNIFYLGLNCERPPFDNVKVRQAVNYAVDVQKIITQIKNGNATAASGPIPPGLIDPYPEITYTYDPQKARLLLAEAGYKEGFSIELWQSQSVGILNVTEAIQAHLSAVGIQVKIVRSDWNMFSKAITEGKADMYYRSWYADYPHAENFLAPLFESGISKKRWTRYSNPLLDGIISNIQNSTEIKRQNELVNKAVDILINDVPWVYLWHTRSAYVAQPNLYGWQPTLMFNGENFTQLSKQ